MKHKLVLFFSLLLLVVGAVVVGCKENAPDNEQTAKQYCSSCHLFPDASLLAKSTWQKNILPIMGAKLGIKYFMGTPAEASQLDVIDPKKSLAAQQIVSLDDWKKIMDYYQQNAPDTDLPQNRQPISVFTNRFTTEESLQSANDFSITYTKIDTANKWIWVGNAVDTSLNIYNDHLKLVAHNKIKGIPVHIFFSNEAKKGDRAGILTNIGIMNPNDLSTGTADSFHININGKLDYLKEVIDHMPRPVQTTIADLNKDGRQDYLVCGFGNKNGALYWMKNMGNNDFEQNFIRALPGAIEAYVDDYNHDGLPDIMALMAQAQEGIYLFTNKGNGNFDTKALLQFPPVYGSSSFELVDLNNDGYKDILYTCGDNADYSAMDLKKYHGIYIFLNDGKNNFSQKYFFPVHGCYKAIAKDFDKDGDLDIAAISFFPDVKNQPEEAFVYLENEDPTRKDPFRFQPFTIKSFNAGNWLTMDAGDVDGDGDVDIVLGNCNPPTYVYNDPTNGDRRPSFLLLRNNTNK